MSEYKIKSDKAKYIVKQYDDGTMFDKLARANAEDSRNIVCGIFNITDALNASSVVRGIQMTARLFGVNHLQQVQTRMLSASWEGDVCEFSIGEESNLSVKVVAEVVPSGNRVWNIILEADSNMCHLTYLLGHITKNGQQASFKILNMINRTEKDYVPEPDPNKVMLSAGKMIELRFTDPNDDINTEIIDPVKGKTKVTLKEHVVVNNNSFIVLKDVTIGELAQGFEHLVKDGFVLEQKKILSRGEIITADSIADLLTSRLPGGLDIGLYGVEYKMYAVVADVFVNSFLKEDGKVYPADLQAVPLDDKIAANEATSVNVHTEEGSVTDEYKAMHPDSVFEELANGVIVEFIKPAKPAPVAAAAPEPEPVQEAETKEETSEEPPCEAETREELPPPPAEIPLEPLEKKEEEQTAEQDGNEGQESPDLVATAGMKVWFGVNPKSVAVVQMFSIEDDQTPLMEFTDSDFEKSVEYRGIVYEVVDNITKGTFKDYKQISELMEHFKIAEPEKTTQLPADIEPPVSEGNTTLDSPAPDSAEGDHAPDEGEGETSSTQEQPKEEQQVEEQKTEEAEEQLNDIGTDPKDLPPKKGIEEEHTVNEFLQILFGTSSPTILHIFKMLNKYGKSSKTYQMTQTFPTIVDIVFTNPEYHFSIVRMKNGCYYKVFVAHTELERDNSGCWEDTHDERGRWMHLINVSDRQVNDAFRGRL